MPDDPQPYRFKLGMFLNELALPLDEALAVAKDIGAVYVWYSRIEGEPEVAEMTDEQVDALAERVAEHDLKLLLISAAAPFKEIHLTDLDLANPHDLPAYHRDLADLVRSMEIAAHLGVGAVSAYTFAWPGEYSAGKPTWPMRWQTRGGVIADVDMDKLVRALEPVLEAAEQHDVDVVLSMMPWNYTNTTANFRRVAERLGSPRIKVMWGPADNVNSGESDAVTRGFDNVRPYLHCLHVKDLHVNDGLNLDFDYRPIGEGDVDFPTLLTKLRDERVDAVLSVATHFRPPSGSAVEAMRINFDNLRGLIDEVESGRVDA